MLEEMSAAANSTQSGSWPKVTPAPKCQKGDILPDDHILPDEPTVEAPLAGEVTVKRKKRTLGRRNSLLFAPSAGPRAPTGLPVEKTQADKDLLTLVLRENANLTRAATFTEDHIRQLVDCAWKESIATGGILMNEGDLDNAVTYIIAEGSVEVSGSDPFVLVSKNGVAYLRRPEVVQGPHGSQPVSVRTIGRGYCIGDTSMMFNQPRLVTARATEPTIAWVICQADFKKTLMSALEDAQYTVAHMPSQAAKSEAEAALVAGSIRFNSNLQRLVPLGPDHITSIAAAAKRKKLEEGQVLMYEGDMNAEAFYIVGNGSLEVSGSEPFEKIAGPDASYFTRAAHTGQALEGPSERTVRIVGKGHCFGEITMLFCTPRFGTVKALELSTLWEVDRATFTSIMQEGAEANLNARAAYLDKVASVRSMPQAGKDKLARLMTALKMKEGDFLTQQGEIASALLILYDGEVCVFKDGQQKEVLSASPAEDGRHHFATDALVNECRHGTSVRVVSKEATVFSLTSTDFKETWDQIIEDEPAPAWQRCYTKRSAMMNAVDVFSLDNLTKVGLLGHGSIGQVHLVRDNVTRQFCALKTVDKLSIVQRGLRQSMVREKQLWDVVQSPFIVRFVRAVNEDQHIHMLFEAVLGGDLSTVYAKNRFFGSHPHTRFYIAGMVYALDYLHSLRIIHRNVKPECLLLTQSGQPKLVNLSLATKVIGQTYTVCGTPHYMAPEVIAGTGQSKAVDWWSLGVMLFELMAGTLPFDGEHPMRVYFQILKGIARVTMPSACTGTVGHLITELVAGSALERLPMRQGGVQRLKEHRWFADFNWEGMLSQQLEPPHVPEMLKESDLPRPLPESEVPEGWENADCGDEFEKIFDLP